MTCSRASCKVRGDRAGIAVLFEEIRDHADADFGLHAELKELFHRDVDLVELGAIKNPYFREAVEESRAPLYGA